MAVIKAGRVDLMPLLTHNFSLNEITAVYRTFGERLDGVIKVGIRP
jgi:alcohol dehydrogenase